MKRFILKGNKAESVLNKNPSGIGRFALYIESRLEDLAGNNLTRPFQRDIEEKNDDTTQEIFKKEFEIQ